ncbi:hypothetical protein F5883DRAFT_404160, partial [Diaporthe sp. PMI_573]
WLRICDRYSTLSLTLASDRVVALAGLAQAIQSATNDSISAGVWKGDLTRGIL